MKTKRNILLIYFILIVAVLYAKNNNSLIKYNNKYGVINNKLDIKLDCIYDTIEIEDNYFICTIDSEYYIFDKDYS